MVIARMCRAMIYLVIVTILAILACSNMVCMDTVVLAIFPMRFTVV